MTDTKPQIGVDDVDTERIRGVILSLIQREDCPKIQTVTKKWERRVKHFSRGMYLWDYDTILITGFEMIPDDEWLMVFLHEWGHATGHSSRLNRYGVMVPGSKDTPLIEAQEELTAWWFTHLALQYLLCTTCFTQNECVGAITEWSSVLNADNASRARLDGELAFQFVFNSSSVVRNSDDGR